MKLIIQLPCYNEEKTLPITLHELPREVEGFDTVEWLLIDDGSTDRSVEIAEELGVDHILRLNKNKGLATVFIRGLDACVKLGADVIVNIDADNQYNAKDIPKLLTPILERKADIVIGARPITEIPHFSFSKKLLQRLGSWVVRRLSYTNVPDAPSGFRAISREAAMKLNVFNTYTYTIEMIIQAGSKGLIITSVPIRVNEELRPSHLIKSIPSYITNSLITIVRIFIVYRPFKTFMMLGLIIFFTGILLGLRYLYFYIIGQGLGHIQSVILVGVLLGLGFQTMLVAFLTDLLAVNRLLVEDVQTRIKDLELDRRQSSNVNFTVLPPQTNLPEDAIRDPLTGVYSRQYLEEFLKQETSLNQYRNPLNGIIMVSIDQSQSIENTYGREAYEMVLRKLGGLFQKEVREADVVCRYDEERFLLVLPNVSLRIISQRAEEFRKRIHQLNIVYQQERLHITTKMGIAALPEHGSNLDHAIRAIEKAIEQAAEQGENTIVVASVE